MAEALGAAVLTVSVDDTQLRAGLAAIEQMAGRTATLVNQAFSGAGGLGSGGLQNASRGAVAGMDALRASSERTRRELDQAAASGQRFEGVFSSVGNTLRSVAALAGVVGVGVLAQQFIATGTASQRADIQLQSLAGAYGEVQQAQEAVARVQKVTGQGALETAATFTQLYAALRGTGLNLEQIQILFVGLDKAARLSGVGAQEAQSAFLQLRQGLSSGRLQGDELRSVLEQLPALSQAIARELGANVGDLRKLGEQGKLTTDVIFNAIRGLADEAAPGRAAVEDIGIAFKTVQVEAAKALGPALTPLLIRAAAGFVALGRFIQENKDRLTAFALITVQLAKSLTPLVLGIAAVRGGFIAWGLAVQAAALAQKALLALSGPAGLAVLLATAAATAGAFVLMQGAIKGSGKAMAEARVEAQKAFDEFQALLNLTPAPEPAVDPAKDLKAIADAAAARKQAAQKARNDAQELLSIDQQRRDTLRQISRELEDNATGIRSPIDVQSVADAIQEGQRQTAAFVRGLSDGIQDAAIEAERAAKALQAAKKLQGTDAALSPQEMAKVNADAQTAGAKLVAAGVSAGRALLDNATQAARTLREAQEGFNGVLRGGFQFLSKPLQEQQLQLARSEFQPLVDRGVIRAGLPTQTPEQIFGLASFARQFNQAEQQVALAQNLKASADAALANKDALIEQAAETRELIRVTQDLVNKDWTVDVKVLPPGSQLP